MATDEIPLPQMIASLREAFHADKDSGNNRPEDWLMRIYNHSTLIENSLETMLEIGAAVYIAPPSKRYPYFAKILPQAIRYGHGEALKTLIKETEEAHQFLANTKISLEEQKQLFLAWLATDQGKATWDKRVEKAIHKTFNGQFNEHRDFLTTAVHQTLDQTIREHVANILHEEVGDDLAVLVRDVKAAQEEVMDLNLMIPRPETPIVKESFLDFSIQEITLSILLWSLLLAFIYTQL